MVSSLTHTHDYSILFPDGVLDSTSQAPGLRNIASVLPSSRCFQIHFNNIQVKHQYFIASSPTDTNDKDLLSSQLFRILFHVILYLPSPQPQSPKASSTFSLTQWPLLLFSSSVPLAAIPQPAPPPCSSPSSSPRPAQPHAKL